MVINHMTYKQSFDLYANHMNGLQTVNCLFKKRYQASEITEMYGKAEKGMKKWVNSGKPGPGADPVRRIRD